MENFMYYLMMLGSLTALDSLISLEGTRIEGAGSYQGPPPPPPPETYHNHEN